MSPLKLLEVIKGLGRVIECKFQRCSFIFNCTSNVALYLDSEQYKKEIKKGISFTVVSEILGLETNSRKAQRLYAPK